MNNVNTGGASQVLIEQLEAQIKELESTLEMSNDLITTYQNQAAYWEHQCRQLQEGEDIRDKVAFAVNNMPMGDVTFNYLIKILKAKE